MLKKGNDTQKAFVFKKKKKKQERMKRKQYALLKNLKNKVFFGSRASVAMNWDTQQTPLKS